MNLKNLRNEWDYYGSENPYFGVYSVDKFNRDNLDSAHQEEFFLSGKEYVDRIWKEISSNLEPNFSPRTALDFGCGVGRLVIPLAERCETVTGVDISEGMLAEAKKNCESRNIGNVNFLKSDEFFSKKSETYDLVNSFIVIQHIKPSNGEKIFRRLVESVKEGGVGVLQVMYSNPMSLKKRLALKVYRGIPLIYRLRTLISGKGSKPYIPVYTYDLNNLFRILQDNDCHQCSVRFSDHGVYGALIYFKKQKEDLF